MAKCKHNNLGGQCPRQLGRDCPKNTDRHCNIIPPKPRDKTVTVQCFITHLDFAGGCSQVITQNKTAEAAGWIPVELSYKTADKRK
jgi:hypothetical protein